MIASYFLVLIDRGKDNAMLSTERAQPIVLSLTPGHRWHAGVMDQLTWQLVMIADVFKLNSPGDNQS